MTDWPSGYDKIHLTQVDSTNAEGARRASSLDRPTWILTDDQTVGRGRRGRPWAFSNGNFAATLVLRPPEAPSQVALRSFVAALALRDACVQLTGRERAFALKWPNDVLLNGGKLAGILLESAGIGTSLSHVCIGIGVNLVASPTADFLEERAVPPTNLYGAFGHVIAPIDFLTTLAQSYSRFEAQLCDEGFFAIRDIWLAHAAKLGETITARTGSVEYEGVFETVDEEGALVLNTAKGRKIVPAAEIFF
jgi:BirA family biotin operon repressor/biotin-[acetyl-CoA-carboxylase] ligase